MILTPVVKMELEETTDLPETIRGREVLVQQVNEIKIR